MKTILKSNDVFNAERNGEKFEGYAHYIGNETYILMTMDEIKRLDWFCTEVPATDRERIAHEISDLATYHLTDKENYWFNKLCKRINYPGGLGADYIGTIFLLGIYMKRNNIVPTNTQNRKSNYLDLMGTTPEEGFKQIMDKQKETGAKIIEVGMF